MKEKLIVLVLIGMTIFSSSKALGWNYPRDGNFKQLHPHRDGWFYVDYRWDLKAPDKWQHFTGTYISQKLLSRHCNRYLSAGITLSVGILKEWEDAYREGWSARDVLMDILGITAGLLENRKCKFLCLYDQEKITLNMYINVNF